MDIPLSTPSSKTSRSIVYQDGFSATPRNSVFEVDADATAVDRDTISGKDDARWKFSGPWIAGQTKGEFNTYVKEEVCSRKKDFREFLRRACADAYTRDSQREAGARGEVIGSVMQASDVTEEQLQGYTKTLRQDRTRLYQLIRKFLDLPPSPSAKLDTPGFFDKFLTKPGQAAPMTESDEFMQKSDSPYANSGPPKTHPSAGLSYGRTSSHLYNHPVFGPQKK
jgi:hypothetical protein